jgi:hypothetical protein
VVGFTTGSREVPEKRKTLTREHDDDDDDNNNDNRPHVTRYYCLALEMKTKLMTDCC